MIRQEHVKRIIGKSRNPDGSYSDDPDIYGDFRRIDKIQTLDHDQLITTTLKWRDAPGDDPNLRRSVTTKWLTDPQNPPADPNAPDSYIPVDLIASAACLAYERDGSHQARNIRPNNTADNMRREFVVKRVTHADTNLDSLDDPTAPVPLADYVRLAGTEDPSQYSDVEVPTLFRDLDYSQSEINQLKPLDLIDSQPDAPASAVPPVRLDEYQYLANVSWGGNAIKFLPGGKAVGTAGGGNIGAGVLFSVFIYVPAGFVGPGIFQFGNNAAANDCVASQIVVNNDGTVTVTLASDFRTLLPDAIPSGSDYGPYWSGACPVGYGGKGEMITDGPLTNDDILNLCFESDDPDPISGNHFSYRSIVGWGYLASPDIPDPPDFPPFQYVIENTSTQAVVAGKWNSVLVAADFADAVVTTPDNTDSDGLPVASPATIESAPRILFRINNGAIDGGAGDLFTNPDGSAPDAPVGSVLYTRAYVGPSSGTLTRARPQYISRGEAVTIPESPFAVDMHNKPMGVPKAAWDTQPETIGVAKMQLWPAFQEPGDTVLDKLSRLNTDPATLAADPVLAVRFHNAFGVPRLAYDGRPSRFGQSQGSDASNLIIVDPDTVESMAGPKTVAP